VSLRNLQQPQGLFCILGCIQLEAQSDSRPQHWHRQLLFAIHSQWQLLHNFQNIFEICDVWWTKIRRFLCYICSPSVPERIGWIPFKKMLKASNGIRLLTASITVVLLMASTKFIANTNTGCIAQAKHDLKVPVPVIDAETKKITVQSYVWIQIHNHELPKRMVVPDTEGIGCNLWVGKEAQIIAHTKSPSNINQQEVP